MNEDPLGHWAKHFLFLYIFIMEHSHRSIPRPFILGSSQVYTVFILGLNLVSGSGGLQSVSDRWGCTMDCVPWYLHKCQQIFTLAKRWRFLGNDQCLEWLKIDACPSQFKEWIVPIIILIQRSSGRGTDSKDLYSRICTLRCMLKVDLRYTSGTLQVSFIYPSGLRLRYTLGTLQG